MNEEEEREEKVIESVKVNSKGQITIPKEMREELGIESGDRVFVQNISGTIVINKPSKEAYKSMAKILSDIE